MAYIEKQIDFVISSDPVNGAQNLSSDGSKFEVQWDEPLTIPQEARNVTVEIQNAEIWWTIPNIITGENDQFSITDGNSGASPSGTAYSGTITIPQGLYNLTSLAEAIETQLVNAGAAQGIISWSEDTATGKAQITANYTGISIDFTIGQSIRDIVGFNSQVLGPSASAPFTWIADNIAAFNTVNYFLIHGDVVDKGLRFNNDYTQILTQVLIDKQPGSQLAYQPFNPAKSKGDHLRGNKKYKFRYWLTDDQNRAVNTSGEYWSARIVVKYLMYLKPPEQ